MELIKNIVDSSKYNIKCPYEMEPEFIVVHNTANDVTARNEVEYMKNNNNTVSFHYAIDDKEIVQGIEENRNAWNAGDGRNGRGNRYGIAIEICYSKSGGERFNLAEKNAVKFIAEKLKEKGWGIDKVKKHQDFNGKYCPHRTLDLGWERFLNMIREELGQTTSNTNEVQSTDDKKEIIRNLQRAYNISYKTNLVEDGVKGAKTEAVMKQYYLKNFTQNELVKWVQDRLVNHKHYSIGNSGIDGKYGKDTENAVRQFQKDNGLIVDGKAGYNTISILI